MVLPNACWQIMRGQNHNWFSFAAPMHVLQNDVQQESFSHSYNTFSAVILAHLVHLYCLHLTFLCLLQGPLCLGCCRHKMLRGHCCCKYMTTTVYQMITYISTYVIQADSLPPSFHQTRYYSIVYLHRQVAVRHLHRMIAVAVQVPLSQLGFFVPLTG